MCSSDLIVVHDNVDDARKRRAHPRTRRHEQVQRPAHRLVDHLGDPSSPLPAGYETHLSADQQQALERKLTLFSDSTSNEITVVIVPHLDGMDPADAAIAIGRTWGVGGKKNNNGVVLLISVEDRKLDISPGYGLEKSLPDITCQQIIKNIIVPNFRGKDYYRGIEEGTDAIVQATKGEFKANPKYAKRGRTGGIGKLIFFVLIMIVFLAVSSGGRGGGAGPVRIAVLLGEDGHPPRRPDHRVP